MQEDIAFPETGNLDDAFAPAEFGSRDRALGIVDRSQEAALICPVFEPMMIRPVELFHRAEPFPAGTPGMVLAVPFFLLWLPEAILDHELTHVLIGESNAMQVVQFLGGECGSEIRIIFFEQPRSEERSVG